MPRRYPLGAARTVEPDEWLSQHDAAGELGVRMVRIGLLIAASHLEPADSLGDVERTMGVTRSSVDAERRWRASASTWTRLRRYLRDAVDWL